MWDLAPALHTGCELQQESQYGGCICHSQNERSPEHRSWPPSGLPCARDVPFSNMQCLSAFPFFCMYSLCSSPYPPQPCSKPGFKNHLLQAVFPDSLCNVEYTLPWTCEPPNPVLCPPCLSTSLTLLPRWPLLLDWKLREDRDHVTGISIPSFQHRPINAVVGR